MKDLLKDMGARQSNILSRPRRYNGNLEIEPEYKKESHLRLGGKYI